MDIQSKAADIFEAHRKAVRTEIQDLVEKHRRYPDGFVFRFRSANDEPEECKIHGAYMHYQTCPNIDMPCESSFEVWYRCDCPSWCLEPNDFVPMSENVVARAIKKYGLPDK